jgi:hypothetical protein
LWKGIFKNFFTIAAKRHSTEVALRRCGASRAQVERLRRASLLEGVCPRIAAAPLPSTPLWGGDGGSRGPGATAMRLPHQIFIFINNYRKLLLLLSFLLPTPQTIFFLHVYHQ